MSSSSIVLGFFWYDIIVAMCVFVGLLCLCVYDFMMKSKKNEILMLIIDSCTIFINLHDLFTRLFTRFVWPKEPMSVTCASHTITFFFC